MKKIMVLLSFAFLILGGGLVAWAGSGPVSLNLKDIFAVEGKKQAVLLPHHQHQAKVPCASCHLNPNGGGGMKFDLENKSGMGNDFHKEWCWPCHETMQVPKGKSCSTCHTGPV